jgi:hypothetical protein
MQVEAEKVQKRREEREAEKQAQEEEMVRSIEAQVVGVS